MRCMACGGEMILTAVKPDDAGMVAGFRHETLQCSVCRDIERRFVYGRASSEQPEQPPVSACPQQPVVSSSLAEAISCSPRQSSSPPQGISSSPSEAIASASTWARAVEKLRSRQAEIRVRADDEKTDRNARFNRIWEKLAPTSRKPPAAGHAAPRRPEHLARKPARALRAELRGLSSAGNRPMQSAIEPPAETIQRFNRFWDSLLPARHCSDLPAAAEPGTGQKP